MPGGDRILFHCDACGMRAKIPARFAAKRIRCPGCRAPALVAGSPATTTRIRAAAPRGTAAREPAGVTPDLRPEPTSVLFHCRACEFRAQVPARSAGKRVRCPRCRREGAVTTAEESARLAAIARAQPSRGIDREAATVRVPSDRLERASDRVARVAAPTAAVETKPASAAYSLAELLDRVAPVPRANRASRANAAPPARPAATRSATPSPRPMAIARPEPTNAAPEQADDPRLALEDDPPNAVGDVASADAAHDDAEPAEQPTASDDARSDADAADAEAGAAESPSDDDGAERHEDGDGGMSAAAEPAPAEPITARRARRERMPQEPASSPWSPTPSPQPILIEVSAAAAAREAPAEPTARHAPPPRRTSGRAGAVRDDGDEPVAEATEDAAAQDEASHPTEQATDDSPGDAADEDASPAPDDADASREQPTSRRFARRRIEDPPRRRVRGVVALVAIAGVIGWTQRDRLATPVSTASPPSAAAHVAARAATTPAVTGTVVANDEVDVVCAAAGTIAKLPFDIGDRVGAGDLVAVIDASAEEAELRKAEAQSAASLALLAQARQNLVATQRKAEADDANARAAVAAAESRARDAAAKSERMAKMLAKRLCSDEEAQSAKELAVQADADLAAARAHVDQVAADALTIEVRRQDVAIAEANANGDEATVDAARRRLAGTRLAAPIAGVVCARPARLGARLDSASPTPLMTIADVSRLFVSVRVPQAEIGRLAVGGAVEIRSPAFPGRVFAGRVDRLGVRGEGGDDGPLFAVRVEALGDALSSLKPAMDAEVAFTAGPEAAAVARTEVRQAR